MCTTGFALEEGPKKDPTRQQAAPLSAPGESSWKQCLRRHLLDQRTHVIPGITSHLDTMRQGPHVSGHTWGRPVACDSPGVTGFKFVWQSGWGEHWPQGSSVGGEKLRARVWHWSPGRLWLQTRISVLLKGMPVGFLSLVDGGRCVVLLPCLTLTLGLWCPRFPEVAVNWIWRYSLWFLQFFFFKKRPHPPLLEAKITGKKCFLMLLTSVNWYVATSVQRALQMQTPSGAKKLICRAHFLLASQLLFCRSAMPWDICSLRAMHVTQEQIFSLIHSQSFQWSVTFWLKTRETGISWACQGSKPHCQVFVSGMCNSLTDSAANVPCNNKSGCSQAPDGCSWEEYS